MSARSGIAVSLFALSAHAATVRIAPDAGGYAELEAAKPGDEVVIAPGTYRFRVELRQRGAAPLVVRAEDPLNPPVFDYSGADLLSFPGSSTSEYRSAWHAQSAFVELRNLVITGAHDPSDQAACLRFNDTTGRATGITARGCDVGLEAGGNDAVFEHCTVLGNRVTAVAGYGGRLAVRYSLVSGSPSLFYMNGSDTRLEYNWFSRAGGFMGIFAGCSYACGRTGSEPVTAWRTLRGNVVLQNPAQTNQSLCLAVNGDTAPMDGTGQTTRIAVEVLGNTFIGVPGSMTAPVTVINTDGVAIDLELSNNAVKDFSEAQLTQQGPATLTGGNNWVTRGTVSPPGLTGTVFGADPRLDVDYRPLEASPLLGAARTLGPRAPAREYFLNETVAARYRVRASASDIGAFERTTAGPGISAQELQPSADAGVAARPRELTTGCGCGSSPAGLVLLALMGFAQAQSRGFRKSARRASGPPGSGA